MSGNNVLDTVNAAASAFVSSDDHRLHQSSPIPRRRKWWNRWSVFICFRPTRQRKRIGKASLAPEPVQQMSNTDSTSNSNSGYRITALPFIAPPSSPASFFQSEPTSATQSPVGILSFSPLPCSNNNRPSIFAIGPYAYEAHQLVSPPVFSTYTTEPSSAPITPPLDESIYLTTTTPSSPEVPFARLFNSNVQNGNDGHSRFTMSNYEFQFYQLPPGSPLGQLISPSSVVSGSGPTSPFPDSETALFRVSDPPKLLSPKTVTTPSKEEKIVRPHKPVSFDLDSDHVIRCVDQKLRTTFPEASSPSSNPEAMNHSSLGSNKEFNFGTDEKHLTIEEHSSSNKNNNNWSFFPVMQSGTLS
ncbi:hypothetical protein AALP_AA3G061900 [Arabis alpina]|uniref:Hydroxyproline-rich glycoprotein family protein n=1 Tax=Arabis alpina TaxID=50452 RepID=A0A087H7D3_ARAAL|nr:hypothetical protein AALP_AA3G061900 [Arabis alpina]